jgi:acetyl-CoA acyltransferase 1
MSDSTTNNNSNNSNSSSDDDVVIVAAVRTPLTKSRKGGLAQQQATCYDLMRSVFHELLHRSSSTALQKDPSLIEDICVGNVLMPTNGYAALRMAHLSAGIPESASFVVVNRQCASSLQAIANVAHAIQSNCIHIGIAAGVENMSESPMDRIKPPHIGQDNYKELSSAALDCLLPMGITSDTIARQYGLHRRELDEMAAESHRRAHLAQQSGKFRAEMVTTCGISQDDGIRPDTSLERLQQLRPAFTPTGMTTAGNSSQTTDGAAGVLMMKRSMARTLKCPVLATFEGFACVGVPPAVMGIGPLYAIPKVLSQLNLSLEEIELFEINEAFATQALYCVRQLQLDSSRVNVNGGAIALGHPLGATGARLVVSLIYELQRRHKQQQPHSSSTGLGVVSMCVGTGMGAAAVLRVEPSSNL